MAVYQSFYMNTVPSKQMNEFVDKIISNSPLSIFLFGIMIGLFASATNGLGASSISRDGQNHFIYKYLPVSFKQFLFGKTIPAAIISFTAVF